VPSAPALTLRLSAALATRVEPFLATAVSQKFASSLQRADHTLWGPEAEPEASIRLGWVANPESARGLVTQIYALRSEFAATGVDSFVLCGMGGSSLAPEVMAKVHSVALGILDSTHPDVVAHYTAQDLSRTAVIVSSKSGGTVETDSQRRAFEQAFQAQGIDPAKRIVIVTDPGSALEEQAKASGYRVFLGNPNIGGRFSALSAFGLVPTGLAGVDIAQVLDQASAAWAQMGSDHPANPALLLGAGIAAGHPTINKVLLRAVPDLPGLGEWIEQLVAESTGKNGKGLLPVVDSRLSGAADCVSVGGPGSDADIEIEGSLGAQFLLWQYATAFAGAILELNPFDQPNVESAKSAARKLLNSGASTDSGMEHRVPGGVVFSSINPSLAPETVEELLQRALSVVGKRGYVALCVFGDSRDPELWSAVREHLEHTLQRPVTLGFGPRFLHSTGQFHKGGPTEGVFISVVEPSHARVDIPGRDFTFRELLEAQANGDRAVLVESGQPTFLLALEDEDARARVLAALEA
jgi:glucose-6-phosphate isomerase